MDIMNVHLLIDAVVRQTMILVAQLATSEGARAALGHTAKQVFFELATELRGAGLACRADLTPRRLGKQLEGAAKAGAHGRQAGRREPARPPSSSTRPTKAIVFRKIAWPSKTISALTDGWVHGKNHELHRSENS